MPLSHFRQKLPFEWQIERKLVMFLVLIARPPFSVNLGIVIADWKLTSCYQYWKAPCIFFLAIDNRMWCRCRLFGRNFHLNDNSKGGRWWDWKVHRRDHELNSEDNGEKSALFEQTMDALLCQSCRNRKSSFQYTKD